MKTILRYWLLNLVTILFFTILLPLAVVGQEQPDEALLFRYINTSSGERSSATPPQATYTVFLNGDSSRVLFENSPRWHDDAENISNTGYAEAQVGNFPEVAVGDTVTMRFTNNSIGEQGYGSAVIDTLPWDSQRDDGFFESVDLQQADFPDRPVNVSLSVNDNNERTVSWDAESGLTYSVYRRAVRDTIWNGKSRKLYTLVGDNIDGGSFTDPNTNSDTSFAYVVLAKNSQGNFSSHSREIKETGRITGVEVSTTPTTVELEWDAYDTEIGQTAGYNIYRRTEDGSYGAPIDFAGLENRHVDSRLEPGQTYYYRIRGRNFDTQEFGESDEIKVTTKTNTEDYHQYANLDAAIAIFKNAEGESISEQHIEDIQKLLYFTNLFFWRHSDMQLNVNFDFYVVRDEVSLCDNDDWNTESCNGNVRNTGRILAEKYGVVNRQHDYVFRFSTPTTGFWSIGVTDNLPFPDIDGSGRGTGFAQITWPKLGGAGYPFEFDNDSIPTPPAVIWTAEHEMQHVLDAIYRFNGHEEMDHGDRPQDFTWKPVGRHYDFQAAMFEKFEAYLDLNFEWGEIMEARDADRDGFPDKDSHVPMDEVRFGSDTTTADTDNDGYTDKQEQTDGLYHYSYSDPTDPDTDGDGIQDGEDAFPRYPVNTTIPQFKPTIDGTIEEGWTVLNDTVNYTSHDQGYAPRLMMSYGQDSLYVGMELENIGVPRLFFDFQNDGRLFGAGNTEMIIDLADERFQRFRTLDGSQEVRDFNDNGRPMWDTPGNSDYQDEFNRRVIYPATVNLAVNLDVGGSPEVQIEMAIPRNELAGVNPEPGWTFQMFVDYDKVHNEPNEWANTWDEYGYARFHTEGTTPIDEDPGGQVKQFKLKENYPNPFNPSTKIEYALPEAEEVTLKVYDLLGREVATLVDGKQTSGNHTVTFDAAHLSSGVYMYRMEAGDYSKIRKMLLLK